MSKAKKMYIKIVSQSWKSKEICKECGQRFNSYHARVTHVRAVHTKEIFTCPNCQYKTFDIANFKRHLKTRHFGNNV